MLAETAARFTHCARSRDERPVSPTNRAHLRPPCSIVGAAAQLTGALSRLYRRRDESELHANHHSAWADIMTGNQIIRRQMRFCCVAITLMSAITPALSQVTPSAPKGTPTPPTSAVAPAATPNGVQAPLQIPPTGVAPVPEDLLQGSTVERRARRKECAVQWEQMKRTKTGNGETWREFTQHCYVTGPDQKAK